MADVYVYGLTQSERYCLIRGHLSDWLKGHSIPAMWTPRLKGWSVRVDRVGDLIALAEHDGLKVRMKGDLR